MSLVAATSAAQLFAVTSDAHLYEAFPTGEAPRLIGQAQILNPKIYPVQGLEYDRFTDKLVLMAGQFGQFAFCDVDYRTAQATPYWANLYSQGSSFSDLVQTGPGNFIIGGLNIDGHFNVLAAINRTQGLLYGGGGGYFSGWCKRDDGAYIGSGMGGSGEQLVMLSKVGTWGFVANLSGLSGDEINGMCAPDNSSFGYASTVRGRLLRVDLYSGVVTDLGALPAGTTDVAFLPAPGVGSLALAGIVCSFRRSRGR